MSLSSTRQRPWLGRVSQPRSGHAEGDTSPDVLVRSGIAFLGKAFQILNHLCSLDKIQTHPLGIYTYSKQARGTQGIHPVFIPQKFKQFAIQRGFEI